VGSSDVKVHTTLSKNRIGQKNYIGLY